MRKLAFCCVLLASVDVATATLAEPAHSGASANIIVAQVGIGTPDCHQQGTLYRMANNCPPEAIARARQEHPIVRYPRRHHHHHYND